MAEASILRPAANLSTPVAKERPIGVETPGRTVRDSLDLVVARAAVFFRGTWAVATPVLAYGMGAAAIASPWRHVMVAVVVAWGAVVCVTCWRRPMPAWVVLVDFKVCAALLLMMGLLLPARLVGDSGTWVFAFATVAIILAAWRLPAAAALAITGVEVISYLVGAHLGHSPLPAGVLAQSAIIYPVQCILALLVIRVMRRSARRADQTLSALNVARRRDEVDQARLRDRQARRLELHDTVLTTLTAIAQGGLRHRSDLVRQRCRSDLELIGQTRGGDVPPDLLARAREHADLRDLRLHVTKASLTDLPPASVLATFDEAVREALSNVERYAGVRDAELSVEGDRTRLVVTVTDAGAGFDPSVVSRSVGLDESVIGRLQAVGGTATVRSAPDVGTTVVLTWTAEGMEPDVAGRAAFEDSARGVVSSSYERGAAIALACVAFGWHLVDLVLMLANWGEYRSGAVSAAAWLATFVVTTVVLVQVIRRGTVDRGARWIALVAIVATLAVIATCTPDGLVGKANWATGELGWILVVLAIRKQYWYWLGLGILVPANLLATSLAFPGSAQILVTMVSILIAIVILQIGALVIVHELRRHGQLVASAVNALHDLELGRATREALRRDRAQRDLSLGRELLPLVRALRDGELDPDLAETQQQCVLAAAELRALIDYDNLTTPIATLDAVAALTRSARTRGVAPTFYLDEALDQAPDGWQQPVVAVLHRLLDEAAPGEATLTVRGAEQFVGVTLCFTSGVPAEVLGRIAEEQARAVLEGVGGSLEVDVEQVSADRAWMEIEWTAS